MANDDVPAQFDADKKAAQELAEVRAEMAKREASARAERESAEVQRFRLMTKFEAELGGPEDVEFAIVDLTDLREGFIVLKLGDSVLFKAFTNAKDVDEMVVDAFVTPCVVHPSKDDYRRIVARRGAVAIRCAEALAKLYGVRIKADAGK